MNKFKVGDIVRFGSTGPRARGPQEITSISACGSYLRFDGSNDGWYHGDYSLAPVTKLDPTTLRKGDKVTVELEVVEFNDGGGEQYVEFKDRRFSGMLTAAGLKIVSVVKATPEPLKVGDIIAFKDTGSLATIRGINGEFAWVELNPTAMCTSRLTEMTRASA